MRAHGGAGPPRGSLALMRLRVGVYTYDLHVERERDIPQWCGGRLKATIVLTSAEQAHEAHDALSPAMGRKPQTVEVQVLDDAPVDAPPVPALVRTYGPPRWLRLGYLLCDVEFIAYVAPALRAPALVG